MSKIFPQYIKKGDITSEQWMSRGMHHWYSAMMCQLGEMAGFADNKEMGAKLESLKMQMSSNGSISRSTFDAKRYELTGCPFGWRLHPIRDGRWKVYSFPRMAKVSATTICGSTNVYTV